MSGNNKLTATLASLAEDLWNTGSQVGGGHSSSSASAKPSKREQVQDVSRPPTADLCLDAARPGRFFRVQRDCQKADYHERRPNLAKNKPLIVVINVKRQKQQSMTNTLRQSQILKSPCFQELNMTKNQVLSTRNQDFQQAKQGKNDEFYTSLEDIELEMVHYTNHFKGKVIYCNCDDPRESNFFRYFYNNFEKLGLKKLITACYRSQNIDLFDNRISERAVYLEYSGRQTNNKSSKDEQVHTKHFKGDGDFRSAESIELLKQADVVVTNPPFSLFKEYCAQLIKYKKKFIIIGNMNAVTYTSIFPLIQNNELWYGPSIRSGDREFRVPSNYPLTASGTRKDEHGNKYIRVKGVRWFTNLDFPSRHTILPLEKSYSPIANPQYANCDAIEVSKTKDIPYDFDGHMGVPISFLDQYSPDQFEILGSSKTLSRPMSEIAEKGTYSQGGPRFYLSNGDGTYRRMYERIVIRKKSNL